MNYYNLMHFVVYFTFHKTDGNVTRRVLWHNDVIVGGAYEEKGVAGAYIRRDLEVTLVQFMQIIATDPKGLKWEVGAP